MKKLRLYIVFFFSAVFGYAQNLVPNPSFEDTVFCPWAENQLPSQWLCFGDTPDYYNSCSSALNVPNTPTGYHPAHSGVGIIGEFIYSWAGCSCPNYREFVGVPLTSTLTIGQKYFMSFYLNFGGYLPNYQQIGADKLGMKFSTVPYSETSPPTLNNFAHLYTDSIYTDTTLWVKVSGSFVADSAYSYLMIGNFFDDASTDYVIFGGTPFGGSSAYYFIDDICVTTDSIFNGTWTGISSKSSNENQLTVYPNPSTDIVNIETESDIEEILMFNSLGELIYQSKSKNRKMVSVNVFAFPRGFYTLRIKTKNNFYSHPILINH